MENRDYAELCRTNADFHRYVDRYCQSRHLTPDQAIQHKLVQAAGDMYAEEEYDIFNIRKLED